ncbi:MAG: hypothetical protein HN849_27615 [Victivallales bacterium]|nr:hypothetical protein [Victivallales bacterium]
MTRTLLFLTLISAACLLPAAEVTLDACRSAANWRFTPGGEFPGAKGRVSQAQAGVALAYDFSGGGVYVATIYQRAFPPGVAALSVDCHSEQQARVQLRVVGASGRTFQSRHTAIKAGMSQTVTVPIAGPWQSAWGGTKAATPQEPLRAVWAMVSKTNESPKQGVLIVQELRATTKNDAPASALLPLPATQATLAGWRMQVESVSQWNNPTLTFTATCVDGQAGWLVIEFPSATRNPVRRYRLVPEDSPFQLSYPLPLPAGGNPRNRYPLRLRFAGDDGQEGSLRLTVTGRQAAGINFGDPRSSRQIASSPFGTCVHFSFGTSGAFKGWAKVDRLLDEVEACGLKWIRDGCRVEKTNDGCRVRPYDLGWIRKAKERGIRTILIIHTSADQPIEEFLQHVEAVVRDTRDLDVVYELGNEPNNFGNWRKTHGGPWNGKEKDNSTSPWVKAHLAYTNAAAGKIKELFPAATVIGLGAVPPTNFRYLDLGVSKALDGVVDHPYTYSLPPERVPFSLAHKERDGVAVGDAEGSFVGLVRSYHEKFRQTGQPRSLWVTEFGFTTFWFDGRNEKGLYAGFSEQAQATYLARRFLQSLALPIEASCQYDLLDDYGSTPASAEANFGLLRADYSRKPSFLAVQRMNALFAGAALDPAVGLGIVAQPLHRSVRQKELVRDWDGTRIDSSNDVVAYGFAHPGQADRRLLAVWNEQAVSNQFNNRVTTLEFKGWQEFSAPPVAVNILTGESFDVKLDRVEGGVRLVDLSVGQAPLAIWLFQGE